ncbi:ribosome hibernation-promoting factor, HPF/YfiA family [Sulfurimonas marina]|uniref:Ribosome-associated translation inhibitor RaiA n=1 Tax=Sulfurimonas marina TaxID=2590551 RepID=A0A7M1ASW5_9BACT|nr:ribosome-associated translation inhibitor RaiA [Sulfurimonas marina]QOP40507.1 ribosome-associated translation inhibitor RaiA [Sulfurimonas marina]
MNLQIRAKDITLTDNTKDHIGNAVEAFKKYSLDITSIDCVIAAEKKGVMVEFNIKVAHANPVIITQHDEDLDAAIDLAVERATKALRRLHERVVSHGAESLKDLEVVDA